MTHIIVLIAEILLGIAVIIPVVSQLVKISKENIKQKNWYYFLDLILKDMEFAQEAYASGETREEMVLKMIEVNADAANYPLTENEKVQLANMIKALVQMANIVGIHGIQHEDLPNTIAVTEEGQEITVE